MPDLPRGLSTPHTTLSALWVGLISGIAQPKSLLVSLLTLKCVEALFLSWESRADVDDNPSGVGATFASGPSQCSAMPVPMQVPVQVVTELQLTRPPAPSRVSRERGFNSLALNVTLIKLSLDRSYRQQRTTSIFVSRDQKVDQIKGC